MRLADIATALNARLDNASPDTEITAVAGIEQAGPGQLTFVSNPKYNAAAKTTAASAVIVAEDFPAISTGMLRSKNPYLAWAKAIELFYQPPSYAPGIHPTAVVHPKAKLGKNAHIGPYVVIDEDVVIGDNAVLLAHVVIYRGVTIGNNFFAHAHAVVREFCHLADNVLLQNGAVVGSDGFGFAKDDAGHWHKIVQSGNVVARKRRRDPGQHLHRPRQHRRNPHRTRRENRQPGADRPQLHRGPRHSADLAGRPGRNHGSGQQRNSRRTSRRRGPRARSETEPSPPPKAASPTTFPLEPRSAAILPSITACG